MKIYLAIIMIFINSIFFYGISWASNYVLEGFIYEKDTHNPLKGVEITVVGAGYSDVTDDEGYFFLQFPQQLPSNTLIRLLFQKHKFQSQDIRTIAGEQKPLVIYFERQEGANEGNHEMEQVGGDITLYNERHIEERISSYAPIADVSVINSYNDSSGSIPFASSDLALRYAYERIEESIQIHPEMPYLLLLSQGGPIVGFDYWWSPFRWQFPKLSVKILNNTQHTLFLTEVAVKVNSSTINLDPVLIIHEDFSNVGNVSIINEGWGRVLDPKIEFSVTSIENYSKQPLSAAYDTIKEIDTFFEQTNVPIVEGVSPELLNTCRDQEKSFSYSRSACLVGVFGKISYTTEQGAYQEVKFKTRVSLIYPGPGVPRPPNYLYDLYLTAGKSGYTEYLPISQEIAPGDIDHFLIRIGTDKSASFDLSLSFRTIDGKKVLNKDVLIDIFVPRSQAKYNNLEQKFLSPWPAQNQTIEEEITEQETSQKLNVEEITEQETSQKLNVDVRTEKNIYSIGEMIVITVQTSQACYLTLYNISSEGNVVQIFPNGFASDNFLQGGQMYSIPSQADRFDLQIAGPPGIEHILALCSTKNINWFDQHESLISSGTFLSISLSPVKFEKFLNQKLQTLPLGQGTKADVTFKVSEPTPTIDPTTIPGVTPLK